MKKTILIIGAGFGGFWSALSAVRLLDQHDRQDISVQVLAPVAELRVRPRFYEPQVHTMRTSLTQLFEATGVQFIPGLARQIDVAQHTVTYQDPAGMTATLGYSALVLAAGSQLNLPDIEGLQAHAFNVDSIEQAERLETHMQRLAALPDTPARSTVVVAGGGFTGKIGRAHV